MEILVTGGAGFIGSNFIHYILDKYSNYNVINLDLLTYCGNLGNLMEAEENPNYKFIKGDILDTKLVDSIVAENNVDYIINFAAESHVDRSIHNPKIFLESNIIGTQNLLEVAKKYHERGQIKKYIQISTDEVYGTLGKTGYFTEKTPLSPNSPYSASKAGADMIVRAYHETFNLPINITRCSNNYGPYQFPEKLIPLMINNALTNKKLPVYGDGRNIRDWLHVYDHCTAIDLVLHNGKIGDIYNIGGNNEKENIEIVRIILKYLNRSNDLIEFVEDRLGHDKRYAIDSTKIKSELGWKPKYTFDNGIKKTIDWYLNNEKWLEYVNSNKYINYYNEKYR
ncbi:dTDP-glucose 4,6-dehydratase [Methanobrevibacter arboriphilus]|jgi:dTDP-glucose 4,6-dehydratase|uniref:dTDP-glucose 4,6-dehydratase n=1 Tax=Methanobrevibacter arboriphilus TaxID=39441 RepID=A0ACA8R472_METAZ|nr:dTDP-glucose 4,6-dehydratase [Methanobrevibacter arboriphilus]MCC7561830.1 dTDP-glucose 4,6-dehydratase [Methanobrevibacter arboriphilus]BBL62178.1 dTDP-glucose 4,6-dehydratase [Methanobrevibacter arboriphilus]GLI11790.1 dTDP-glucose 4,6-dehydratase [Methanobrevibacter arboriphilus]